MDYNYALTEIAPIAQLDRALVFGTSGWEFESLWAHFQLSRLLSFNKRKDQFRLDRVNTIKSFRSSVENRRLAFTLHGSDYSVKRQQIAPKKFWSLTPRYFSSQTMTNARGDYVE
jgi:hypothetical protein